MEAATTSRVSAVERPEGFWDGTEHAYIPGPEVKVPEPLRLHQESETEIDPITFEVVRHGLWNANAEHVRVIENLAVSQIAVEVRDFQPCIMTEDAELLYFGPNLQYMSGMLDVLTRYVIEHRGDTIREGDMWLCNDPIIGTAHQPDVGLMCPVFVDGQVFCWVANIVHQNDIGGTVPGSFCPNAEDAFWDPPSFPPFKIVEDDRIVRDMEALYRRCSRTPENLSLDLRATVAGNAAARDRILSLVEKYGPAVVKGTMRRALDASQKAFEEVMDTIPDGVYSERLLQEVARTGDRGTYFVQTSVTKRGRELTFDNEGTHESVGSINIGFASWRGAILGAINVLMLAEQMGCVGGAARNCAFEPVPGAITSPDWGAAVSPAGLYGTHVAVSLSNAIVTKMMLASTDHDLRDRALSTEAAQWGAHIGAGDNQRGDYYVAGHGDSMIGGTGATWKSDGIFANGRFWVPDGRGPNLERYENDWPILYLYRREHADSGGAGRFRAANGGEIAYISHKGNSALGIYTTETIPKTMGVFGGGPGPIMRSRFIKETNVLDSFAKGEIPQDLDLIEGEELALLPKGDALPMADGDVMYWNWLSPSGYGDPLTRDAEKVAEDVADGTVSAETAEREYGVLLAADGSLDSEGTDRLRGERFRARVGGDPAAPVEVDPDAETIADIYVVDRDGDSLDCYRCGTSLGSLDSNPKDSMVLEELPVADLSPDWPDPAQAVDQQVNWRSFSCPGCGVRLATEVAHPGDPFLREISLEH